MASRDLHFVKYPGHLFADERILQPTAEWVLETDAWLFLHLRSGEACWIEARCPCLLNSGDTLLVPPRHAGTVRASMVMAATILFFRFCPDLLPGFLTLSERTRAAGRSKLPRQRATVFHRSHHVSRELARFCQNIEERNGALARSRLLQIAVKVLVQGQPLEVAEQAAFLTAGKRAELLFRQLSEAELLEQSPSELAVRCGCSVRHFNKLFRGRFGVSLRDQQREFQLAKSRQLLAETEMRVSEIAITTGFREQGRFSSAFKRHFGVTPSEWRQSLPAGVKGGHTEAQRNGSS